MVHTADSANEVVRNDWEYSPSEGTTSDNKAYCVGTLDFEPVGYNTGGLTMLCNIGGRTEIRSYDEHTNMAQKGNLSLNLVQVLALGRLGRACLS